MINYIEICLSFTLFITLMSSVYLSQTRPIFEDNDIIYDNTLNEKIIEYIISVICIVYLLEIIFCYWINYNIYVSTTLLVLKFIGVFLVCIGVLLREWARIELGRFFTFQIGIRKNHVLIQTGPYSVIRHPSYIGHLLTSIGLLLYACTCVYACVYSSNQEYLSYLAYCAIIIPIIMVVINLYSVFIALPNEEIMLSKAFPDEWKLYSKHTWRILPFIW